MGLFSAGPINKAVKSFGKRLREYMKTGRPYGRGHFEHVL